VQIIPINAGCPDRNGFRRKITVRSLPEAPGAEHCTEFLLKKFSTILTLSALLAPMALVQAASPSSTAVVAPQEVPPNVALSEQLIYKYLMAELSFQRGETFAAYSTMIALARSTSDARLARRALEFAATGSLPVEALKAARLWHELAPRSEEASQALIGLLIANTQLDEAKSALAQQLAASTPATLPGAIANTQRQLARVSDRTRAQAMLRELLEPYRNSLDVQIALVQSAMVAGDRPTALREARAALLAYAFIRGRDYAACEAPGRWNPPDLARVRQLVDKFGKSPGAVGYKVPPEVLTAWVAGELKSHPFEKLKPAALAAG